MCNSSGSQCWGNGAAGVIGVESKDEGGAGVPGGDGLSAAGGDPPGAPKASSKSTECCALSAAPILTSYIK